MTDACTARANYEQDTKDQTPNITSEELETKAGYCTWSWQTAVPRRCTKHLKPLSSPIPGSAPTLTPRTSFPPASPLQHLWGSKQGHLLLVFTPLYCSMNRNKALLEILIWPLLSFYWLKSPRTQTDHITMLTPLLPELRRSGGVEVWTRSNPMNRWIVIISLSVCLPN